MLTARRHAGFTLVELLVVITILALVLTTVTSVFIQQQRFYAGTSAISDVRSATRDAGYVLESELRGLSPTDSDIYAMSASSIEFRSNIGASVVCTIDPSRTSLTVPPLSLSSQAGLTSWASAPALGDTLLIFDPGPLAATSDDVWRKYTLVAAPAGAGACPTTTKLTTTAAEAAAGWTLVITPALSPSSLPGAAIRFFRRAHYELYRSATSGNWYLGYYDCVPSRTPACGALQPVSGPYLPLVDGAPSGIELSYFDSLGAVTANRTLVSRIGVIARAQTASGVRMPGATPGPHLETQITTIAPRN